MYRYIFLQISTTAKAVSILLILIPFWSVLEHTKKTPYTEADFGSMI